MEKDRPKVRMWRASLQDWAGEGVSWPTLQAPLALRKDGCIWLPVEGGGHPLLD